MQNQTPCNTFEWYLPYDGQHWTRLAEDVLNTLLNLAVLVEGVRCHQL